MVVVMTRVEEQVKEWREEGDRGGNDKILSFFADVYVFSVHVVPRGLAWTVTCVWCVGGTFAAVAPSLCPPKKIHAILVEMIANDSSTTHKPLPGEP